MCFKQLDWEKKGLDKNKEYLNNLRFVNDIVQLTKRPAELQEMLKELNRKSEKVGLKWTLRKPRLCLTVLRSANNTFYK